MYYPVQSITSSVGKISECLFDTAHKQVKSEGFVSCDRPSNLTQFGFETSIFQPVLPQNLRDDHEKLKGTSSILHQALGIISNPSVNSNWSYSPETPNLCQNWQFFWTVWPCNWRMTLKIIRAPLHSRAACTQPCNVNTHSRAHCSPGAWLCEQWGHGCVNNWARLCAGARLCRGSPVSRETPNLGQIRRFLESCDLQIWRMTLKNNRAPLLSNIKLCA